MFESLSHGDAPERGYHYHVTPGHLGTCGAQVARVAAISWYQVKFSYEKFAGHRAMSTTVVQAKSTTEAQRQVKASYHKVNIITIKKL